MATQHEKEVNSFKSPTTNEQLPGGLVEPEDLDKMMEDMDNPSDSQQDENTENTLPALQSSVAEGNGSSGFELGGVSSSNGAAFTFSTVNPVAESFAEFRTASIRILSSDFQIPTSSGFSLNLPNLPPAPDFRPKLKPKLRKPMTPITAPTPAAFTISNPIQLPASQIFGYVGAPTTFDGDSSNRTSPEETGASNENSMLSQSESQNTRVTQDQIALTSTPAAPQLEQTEQSHEDRTPEETTIAPISEETANGSSGNSTLASDANSKVQSSELNVQPSPSSIDQNTSNAAMNTSPSRESTAVEGLLELSGGISARGTTPVCTDPTNINTTQVNTPLDTKMQEETSQSSRSPSTIHKSQSTSAMNAETINQEIHKTLPEVDTNDPASEISQTVADPSDLNKPQFHAPSNTNILDSETSQVSKGSSITNVDQSHGPMDADTLSQETQSKLPEMNSKGPAGETSQTHMGSSNSAEKAYYGERPKGMSRKQWQNYRERLKAKQYKAAFVEEAAKRAEKSSSSATVSPKTVQPSLPSPSDAVSGPKFTPDNESKKFTETFQEPAHSSTGFTSTENSGAAEHPAIATTPEPLASERSPPEEDHAPTDEVENTDMRNTDHPSGQLPSVIEAAVVENTAVTDLHVPKVPSQAVEIEQNTIDQAMPVQDVEKEKEIENLQSSDVPNTTDKGTKHEDRGDPSALDKPLLTNSGSRAKASFYVSRKKHDEKIKELECEITRLQESGQKEKPNQEDLVKKLESEIDELKKSLTEVERVKSSKQDEHDDKVKTLKSEVTSLLERASAEEAVKVSIQDAHTEQVKELRRKIQELEENAKKSESKIRELEEKSSLRKQQPFHKIASSRSANGKVEIISVTTTTEDNVSSSIAAEQYYKASDIESSIKEVANILGLQVPADYDYLNYFTDSAGQIRDFQSEISEMKKAADAENKEISEKLMHRLLNAFGAQRMKSISPEPVETPESFCEIITKKLDKAFLKETDLTDALHQAKSQYDKLSENFRNKVNAKLATAVKEKTDDLQKVVEGLQSKLARNGLQAVRLQTAYEEKQKEAKVLLEDKKELMAVIDNQTTAHQKTADQLEKLQRSVENSSKETDARFASMEACLVALRHQTNSSEATIKTLKNKTMKNSLASPTHHHKTKLSELEKRVQTLDKKVATGLEPSTKPALPNLSAGQWIALLYALLILTPMVLYFGPILFQFTTKAPSFSRASRLEIWMYELFAQLVQLEGLPG